MECHRYVKGASGRNRARLAASPMAFSSFCFSHRTEEKKPLTPRTLPRRPYKVLLATLTTLYQQLDQSEKPWGAGGLETVIDLKPSVWGGLWRARPYLRRLEELGFHLVEVREI